mmetsp:Transcript_17626/g.40800  ORF Transcript_17626/g.40800 Transcript_17626/m.40800 type:complete len:685 (+) Transcript_17626:47-2101(+)
MADSLLRQEFLLLKQNYVEDFEEKCKPHQEEHAQRLREMRDRGALLLACSYVEPCLGAVFHFDSKQITLEEVKAWAHLDPYVANGLVTGSAISSNTSSSSEMLLGGPAGEVAHMAKVAVMTGSSFGRADVARGQSTELGNGGMTKNVASAKRRLFVHLQGSTEQRAVAWYPGTPAEQIENAVAKACSIPLGTPMEFMDGEEAVVISSTIPDGAVLTVVPLASPEAEVRPRSQYAPASRASPRVGEAPPPHGGQASTSPLKGKRREPQVQRVPSPAAPSRSSMRASSPDQRESVGGSTASSSQQQQQDQLRGRSATPCGCSGGTGSATPSGSLQVPPQSRGPPGRVTRDVSEGVSGTGSSQVARQQRPSNTVDGLASAGAHAPGSKLSSPDEHCIHILAGHAGFVLSLCTVGDVLFTGSQDNNIMIWDLNNLQYIGTLPGHRGFVKCMAAALARKVLCSGSQDKTIKVWSLETFSSVKTLTGHTSDVNALTILEGADVFVSGSEDKTIKVWAISTLTLVANLEQAHQSSVFALAQLDSGHFISASRDRSIKVWTTSSWQGKRVLTPPHYDGITGVAVGPTSGHFYSASRDRSIRRWDMTSMESDLQLTNAHGDWLTSLTLSPSESVLFSGSKDCVVKVWGTDLQCKDNLLGHKGPITSLVTTNGLLFSASHDRTVRVWKTSDFEH